jgi:adenylosuccinate lyase
MDLSSLTAVSSVDGRYGSRTEVLRDYCSEYGLIRQRVIVEIRWFQALCNNPEIHELPALSRDANQTLEDIISGFGPDEAALVKKIEDTTNHDVKAIEYFLKQKFEAHQELASGREFIHFA